MADYYEKFSNFNPRFTLFPSQDVSMNSYFEQFNTTIFIHSLIFQINQAIEFLFKTVIEYKKNTIGSLKK